MILDRIGFLPIELKVAGGFEESVFGAGHEVLFVLEEVELVSDGILEVVLGAFASDKTVDEVVLGDLGVD